MGDISTHVISKLGAPSISGSKVRLFFNENLGAGFMDAGWALAKEAALSANGGIDDLVPIGSLKRGVYLVEYDFSGMDAAARQIFKKQEDGSFNPLNPTGFFLAPKTCINLKIEDPTSFNHLVLSVGDKVMRAHIRAHPRGTADRSSSPAGNHRAPWRASTLRRPRAARAPSEVLSRRSSSRPRVSRIR